MGQLFSSSHAYHPPKESPSRPPHEVPLAEAIGPGSSRYAGALFYVDFDDPASLVRELQRFHMVGVVGWPEGPESPSGILYLIGYDDMPTSILKQYWWWSAVYPAELSNEAILYTGGQILRQSVEEHRSFHETKNENPEMGHSSPAGAETLTERENKKTI
ncbi:hypothetical protein ABW19_dt0209776 [Dactylella cylindrospora]|nr:hypothetical protein ABW19_dt0209776 [Dactylella cylindrospora]